MNEKKYEAVKQIAVNELLMTMEAPTTKRQRSFEALVLNLVDKEGYSQKKVSEMCEMTPQSISNIINRIKFSPKTP